jgi:murein DD-endopeptidase MepM/ murein hydrolase activator NlpD
MDRRPAAWALIVLALAGAGCDSDSITAPGGPAICEGYPDWQGSPYLLPYPVGAAYLVSTANCDGGHIGPNKYGYDFAMPIGAPITAMRGGTVVLVDERFSNDDRGQGTSNWLIVDHGDGTYSTYFHMTRNGIVVERGETVRQGQLVAFSGSSGTGRPHVHVHVKPCQENSVFCLSTPFQFGNADPPPSPTGLEPGVVYTALPYAGSPGGLRAPVGGAGKPVTAPGEPAPTPTLGRDPKDRPPRPPR